MEDVLVYASFVACILASAYLLYSGSQLAGSLFLIGFLLQGQGMLYMHFIGHPEGTGDCWATVQDYYLCLPISARISMHLAQAGPYALALGIFTVARNSLGAKNAT